MLTGAVPLLDALLFLFQSMLFCPEVPGVQSRKRHPQPTLKHRPTVLVRLAQFSIGFGLQASGSGETLIGQQGHAAAEKSCSLKSGA